MSDTKRRAAPPPSPPPPRKRRRSRFAAASDAPAPPPDAPPLPAVAALKARVASRFAAAPKRPSPTPAVGRLSAIPVAPVATLRINDRAARGRKLDSLAVRRADLLETNPALNPYYDPEIVLAADARRAPKATFSFVDPGAITAKAERQRRDVEAEAMSAAYRAQLAVRARQVCAEPVLPPLAEVSHPNRMRKPVPDAEWWDVPFLVEGVYPKESLLRDDQSAAPLIRHSRVTHYVHHPRAITHSIPQREPPVLKLMLTKKETKRLRRQRRMEKNKETQEMIAVGLIPPPPPKVKLSNLMRVLANEASADPTHVEAEVRAQVEERQRKHDADNEARKKTKEERHDKLHQIAAKDRQAGLEAVVFRLTSADNPQHRFKIDMNARQLELSGALVVFDDCNVVVVEGGAKALRKFKKLMLRRIDWTASVASVGPTADDTTENGGTMAASAQQSAEPARENQCVLVWEGVIASKSFADFKTAVMRTDSGCRSYFRRHRVEHYWDLCTQACPVGDKTLGVRSL